MFALVSACNCFPIAQTCRPDPARPYQTRPDLSRKNCLPSAWRPEKLRSLQDNMTSASALCVYVLVRVRVYGRHTEQVKSIQSLLRLAVASQLPFFGININASSSSSSSSSSAHCHFHFYPHSHCHSHHHCHCRPSACPAKPVGKMLPISFSFQICQNANSFGSGSP